MKISIFGLGYVGCVSAACLARDGHEVIGVDVNQKKLDLLAEGKSPIVEPGLKELIQNAIRTGCLRVTSDHAAAIRESDISLICVGTPSNDNGSLKLDYVERVCGQVGEVLADKDSYHVVTLRSTVLPETIENRVLPILEEASGKHAGADFGLCMNPEFLREGSAIRDYDNPSFIVIGEIDQRSGNMVEEMYASIEATVIRTSIRSAEMVKYVCNAFHALKIVFANEIGNLCKAHGIDGQEIMDTIGQDRQLNISTAYLRPGYAFGGSCLPKDVRALIYRARERDVDCKMLEGVLPSNQYQIQRGIQLVERTGLKKVGILGLSFKADTDDLRESPAIVLAETLLGRGYQIRIFDDQVQLARLIGANKEFIETELPHITSHMCDSIEELVDVSEVLVITQGNDLFRDIPSMLSPDQKLIDLVGVAKSFDSLPGTYEGICW
jgi:GDP-mannose 6-dehydrogenase